MLRASRGVLSSNGLVVFTVETAEGAERTANGWALGEGGRFVHDATYVARALGESGFESCEVVEEVLRYELGAEARPRRDRTCRRWDVALVRWGRPFVSTSRTSGSRSAPHEVP